MYESGLGPVWGTTEKVMNFNPDDATARSPGNGALAPVLIPGARGNHGPP